MEEVDEEYFEKQFSIPLKAPIDVQSMLKDGGSQFELDVDGIQQKFDSNSRDAGIDQEHLLQSMNSAALGSEDDDEEDDDGDDLGPFESQARKMMNLTEDGGVKKRILQAGTGDVIKRGQTVYYHYSFLLEHSDEAFDCSRMRGKQQKTVVARDGDSDLQVIEGVDIGLASMRVHEVSRFLITPEYAYGDLGIAPRIPPKSTIMAEIEVMNVMDTGAADAYLHMPISARKEASFDMCLQAVRQLKKEGKDFFLQKRYERAAKKYHIAVDLLENARLADDEDEDNMYRELLACQTNCALTHLKLEEYKRVIATCNTALHSDGKNAKLLYLKGKALFHLNDLHRAQGVLLEAKRLKQGDSNIAKALHELERRLAKDKQQESDLYTKMCAPFKAKLETSSTTAEDNLQVDPEFEKVLRTNFQEFKDGKTETLKLPQQNFAESELTCVRNVAKSMDLFVHERKSGREYEVILSKNADL